MQSKVPHPVLAWKGEILVGNWSKQFCENIHSYISNVEIVILCNNCPLEAICSESRKTTRVDTLWCNIQKTHSSNATVLFLHLMPLYRLKMTDRKTNVLSDLGGQTLTISSRLISKSLATASNEFTEIWTQHEVCRECWCFICLVERWSYDQQNWRFNW